MLLESDCNRLRPHRDQARHSRKHPGYTVKRGCYTIIISFREHGCGISIGEDARAPVELCSLSSSIDTADKVCVAELAAT